MSLRRWRPKGARMARSPLRSSSTSPARPRHSACSFSLARLPTGVSGAPRRARAIAAIAFTAEVRLKPAVASYLDSSIAVALIALAVAGPLPALVIWVIPDLLSRVVLRQDPILSPGMLATWSGTRLRCWPEMPCLRLPIPRRSLPRRRRCSPRAG